MTARRGKFTDDQILDILTSVEGMQEIARRYKTSRQVMQQIRYGHTYQAVHPNIPRWNPKQPVSCLQCVHWQSETCSMELPEPQQIGPQFARECATFHRVGTGSPVQASGSAPQTTAS